MNRDNPANAGDMLLQFDELNDLFDSKGYKSHMSRADFFALAGIAAIEAGIENNDGVCREMFPEACMRMVRTRVYYVNGFFP